MADKTITTAQQGKITEIFEKHQILVDTNKDTQMSTGMFIGKLRKELECIFGAD